MLNARQLFCLALAGIAMTWMVAAGQAFADEPPLPQNDKVMHLGVASCASSTCHGAVTSFTESTILLNEYVTWVRKDKHAKAYEVLLNDESKRIARNLGLKNAHEADLCLDCHADNVPAAQRGPSFQLSEGVGCEACHGGSEKWLSSHAVGPPHAENISLGLYPTDDPVARAELCLSCHFGNKDKFVTHRIMGAGHPRMSFELDTFTQIQPAHFVIDDDYRKRKRVSEGVQLWAVGQAVAARDLLAALVDSKRNRDGMFPELVLFDCHACHSSMSKVDWQPTKTGNRTPGMPHVNGASLLMLRIIADAVDPARGKAMASKTRALHKAVSNGMPQMVSAARDLQVLTDEFVQKFASHKFEAEEMQAILSGLIATGLQGEYADYAAAEQVAMAMDSIIAAMVDARMVSDAKVRKLQSALDAVYNAVDREDSYSAWRFNKALKGMKGAIAG